MEKLKTEFNYELTTKFKYHFKGEVVEASFIALTAPSSKNIENCAPIKQSFFQAIGEQSKNTNDRSEPTDEDIDGDSIMMLIQMSKTVNMSSVLMHARELFSSGVALIDGETKLTKPLIDLMSIDDFEGITGQYLANFILVSVLNKLNAK
jgi:hypothetical protein